MNLPNKITMFRVFLIPVFVILLMLDEIPYYNFIALAVFSVACFSDFLDGYLARKNGWTTEAGKILDPLADKLMQAAAIISLAVRQPVLIWLVVLFVAKESCMLAGALFIVKKRKAIAPSSWYGKAASAVFACVVAVLILMWENELLAVILSVLLGAVLVFALLMYYLKVFRGKYGITSGNDMDSDK